PSLRARKVSCEGLRKEPPSAIGRPGRSAQPLVARLAALRAVWPEESKAFSAFRRTPARSSGTAPRSTPSPLIDAFLTKEAGSGPAAPDFATFDCLGRSVLDLIRNERCKHMPNASPAG